MNFWTILYAVIAGVIALVLLRYRVQILRFAGEVRVELEKCSWPWDPAQTGFKKYKELIESTAVVVISVILLAGFVTFSDFILAHVVGALTGVSVIK